MPHKFLNENSTAGHKEIIGETIAKLILHKRGFNPYSRFLDKEAIDLIVRNDKGKEVTYNEIQVKYSKKYLDPDENYWFKINQRTFNPRFYYYFMFICEDDDKIFIIPSLTLKGMLKKIKLNIKKEEDFGKWHIIIRKKENKYFLDTMREEEKVDITGYLNDFNRLR